MVQEILTNLTDTQLEQIFTEAGNEQDGMRAIAEAAHQAAWNEAMTTIQREVTSSSHFYSVEYGRLIPVLNVFDICAEQKIRAI